MDDVDHSEVSLSLATLDQLTTELCRRAPCLAVLMYGFTPSGGGFLRCMKGERLVLRGMIEEFADELSLAAMAEDEAETHDGADDDE